LIQWGAKASYEAPVEDIYLLISTGDSLRAFPELKIIHERGDKKIIGITRWGAFTKTIVKIAEEDIDIIEIGGNDEILVSVLIDKNKTSILSYDGLLYESNVVSNSDRKRSVYLLPVSRLLSFIKAARREGVTIEHVFDY
jgi:hypothetical protein